MTTTQTNHAIANALGHLESIRAWKRDYDLAQNGRPLLEETVRRILEEHDREGLRFSADELIEKLDEEADEMPLSVQVREGWHSLGESGELADFEILLTTGGPALRIIGELDKYAQPANAKMQWQDWGTPWTDLHGADLPDGLEPSEYDDVLLAFASHFYFGEG